jgi:DNA polymerase III subunit delta'
MAFKDIRGQVSPIARLQGELRNNHLAGAYLFSGPEGLGKKLAAFNFAKALNCLENKTDACDNCISCRKIENKQHPDIHILDPGRFEEIKIDDIRFLQQEIVLRPYEARYKVFIINDAHNLNAESANAFLKTLEEPPKSSVIILVTDKPRLLFRTIISRCQNVKFSALGQNEFEQVLRDIYSIDEGALRFLSFFCEGRIGSAIAWKDKDIIAQKNRVIDFFGPQGPANAENSFIQDRETFRESLSILAGWFRDLYFLKAGINKDRIINIDRSDILEKLAARYTFNDLEGILNGISQSLLYLEQNANVKLLLANLLLSVRKN